MSLIFRIAAGIIIGLLAYQVILMKMYPPDYYQVENRRLAEQGKYINKITFLEIAISDYYKKNGILPTYASDINCDRRQSDGKDNSCVNVQRDGIFYTVYQDNWAAVEPYLSRGRVQFKCHAITDFVKNDDRYSHCKDISTINIPSPATPSFNCLEAISLVEKTICNSDRLIDIDLTMTTRYKQLLSRSSKQTITAIQAQQTAFMQNRESQCLDEECIETMTRKRIAELDSF